MDVVLPAKSPSQSGAHIPGQNFKGQNLAGQIGSAKALDPIRQALRQDVPALLRPEFPVFANYSNTQIYESVLENPDQLAHALRLLKTRPDLFTKLLVDAKGAVVDSPDGPLSCGRSLADIVTLVVRASAKRYFRRKLGGNRKVLLKARPRTSFQQFTDMLGLTSPPPRRIRKELGRGDKLYQAICGYLRFEWQAALIPSYAPIPIDAVELVGEKLLEIREPAELRALASAEVVEGLRRGRTPIMLMPASALMRSSGDAIDPEILLRVVSQMDLARLFPDRDGAKLRVAVASLTATARPVVKELLGVLGQDCRQFVGFLMIAYVTLGEAEYGQCFAADGKSQWVVKRIIERLKTITMPLPILADMKAAYMGVIRPAKESNQIHPAEARPRLMPGPKPADTPIPVAPPKPDIVPKTGVKTAKI